MRLVSLALLLASTLAGADTATITLRPDVDGGAVNRRVLGTNDLAYHWSPDRPERDDYCDRGAGVWDPVARRPVPEMVELARAAGVTTLRWPGGCATHRYRWKDTVGPVEQRPHQQFGLHEFLVRCEAVGAEPILSVAVYEGTAADAADLVEYLNAPVGANPSGGEDYAAIRAAQGRAEPWGVVWFEYGNESDHGEHGEQRFTPEQYAAGFRAYRAAMRAVDPGIKLGVVLTNTRWNPDTVWTRTVLSQATDADFVIHHAYLPGYSSNEGKETPAEIFINGFAVDRQWREHYLAMDKLVSEITGRRLPFAITEFNGHFVQQEPYPYRLTHANALVAGLILTALLDPELPIDNAQYWQFSNEYWGAVKGYEPPYVKRPAQLMFELYHRYLGDRFVGAELDCGRFDAPGGFGVRRMAGEPRAEDVVVGEVPLSEWSLSDGDGFTHAVNDGVLEVTIGDPRDDLNYYHAARTGPAAGGRVYRLTAELRAEGLNPVRGAQLQIGDARGWTATRSVALTEPVLSGEWTPVRVDYASLPDTTGIAVQARRMEGGGAAGRLAVRGVKVVEVEPANLGAVPLLTAVATRADGGARLLVFNKSLAEPCELTVRLPGAASARAESMVAPALESTNEQDPNTVRIVETAAEVTGEGVRLTLPPFSLTGVAIAAR